MKLAQQSVVHFLSRIGSSIGGALAFLYLSRALGPDILGKYFVVNALVAWLVIPGHSVSMAIAKRISETTDESEVSQFVTAGLSLIAAFGAVTIIGILLSSASVDRYVGATVTGFVVVIFLARLANSTLGQILIGQGKVEYESLLNPMSTLFHRGLQVGATVVSLGLTGMLGGYAVGVALTNVFALRFLSVSLARPARRHFDLLVAHARYVWLSALKGRSFSSLDTLVLAAFVASTFVGAYGVAWNIASLLSIFAVSVGTALFPEISRESETGGVDRISNLVTDALRYSGLFVVPGIVGSLLLGPRILALYGREVAAVESAALVLTLLIGAQLVNGYLHQLINALNAVDRADLAFRASGVFILCNLVLNVALVWWIGWVGAAVATLTSAVVSLGVSFGYSRSVLNYRVPAVDIGRQWLAAGVMAAVVFVASRELSAGPPTFWFRAADTVALVGFGAVVYFASLGAVSPNFRTKLRQNLPIWP